MPFDPAQPSAGSPLASQMMRDQFNGLKELIDAVPAGPPGEPGPQGPPGAGEVSTAQLVAAIDGTARNPGLGVLALSVSDPPTQAEVQAVANKLDALIVALNR